MPPERQPAPARRAAVDDAITAATIRDVARRAGVSTATVSRVISGAMVVRPETRARVLEAAAALGYRPSGVARSLKLRTTRTLGLLVTDIQNPYFPEVVRAIEDVALEHELSVLLCNGAEDPVREETYLQLLIERRVDGLIIASSGLQERHRDLLAQRRSLPVVLVNCTGRGLALPAVLSDNRAGGRIAAEHLLALGHRRIGHVSAPSRNAAAAERLAGIRDALASAGLGPEDCPVVEGDGRVAGGERAVAALLAADPRITGIVCYNDLTAIGVIRGLRALGRHVPTEVSVVGFDDIALASWVDPPLTTVAQQIAMMGRWAVERLVESIGAGAERHRPVRPVETRVEPVLLGVELRVRGSTAPPARSVAESAQRPGTPAGGGAEAAAPGGILSPAAVGPAGGTVLGSLHRVAGPPAPEDGAIVRIAPPFGTWRYVEFAVHRLEPGARVRRSAGPHEVLVLVLEGRASVRAGTRSFGSLGSRTSVFDGPPPPVVLVAPGTEVELIADTPALVALAAAPAGEVRRTALVAADDILVESRGSGATERRIHHLLPPAAEAGRLIAYEVFTPGGNWSSYPPHKHDTEDPPREAYLEEVYFYRFARPTGFAVQRVYTPDRSLDETITAGDSDTVLVPAGYHVVGAAAGYDCYYLNVMAGPNRAWRFTVDPDHAWLMDWNPQAPRTG